MVAADIFFFRNKRTKRSSHPFLEIQARFLFKIIIQVFHRTELLWVLKGKLWRSDFVFRISWITDSVLVLSKKTGFGPLAIVSILILPKKISFWRVRCAGTSKKAPRTSFILSSVRRDNFIGACNNVKTSIADQTSSSISVLASKGIESKVHTNK